MFYSHSFNCRKAVYKISSSDLYRSYIDQFIFIKKLLNSFQENLKKYKKIIRYLDKRYMPYVANAIQ